MPPIRRVLAVLAAATSLARPALPAGTGPSGSSWGGGAGPVHPSPIEGPGYGTYAWPVHGPVIRGFEPPPDPYSAGHRGIDIGTPFGSDMVAARSGTVAFAGWVGGSLFISIDHDDGVRTTYSWLSGISVRKGDQVSREQSIGLTGQGHPGSSTPHLHFGARVGSTYIDPMLLLEPGAVAGVIHLAPLIDPGEWPLPPGRPGWPGMGGPFDEFPAAMQSGHPAPPGRPALSASDRYAPARAGGPPPRGPPLQ